MGDCNSFGWDDEEEATYCSTAKHRVNAEDCKKCSENCYAAGSKPRKLSKVSSSLSEKCTELNK